MNDNDWLGFAKENNFPFTDKYSCIKYNFIQTTKLLPDNTYTLDVENSRLYFKSKSYQKLVDEKFNELVKRIKHNKAELLWLG